MPGSVLALVLGKAEETTTSCREALIALGHRAEHRAAAAPEEVRAALGEKAWDVVLLCEPLGHMTGQEVLELAWEKGLFCPVICLAAPMDHPAAHLSGPKNAPGALPLVILGGAGAGPAGDDPTSDPCALLEAAIARGLRLTGNQGTAPEAKPTKEAPEDLARLREAERELRERNAFIQTILDNLPIGLAVNRIGDGRTLYTNQRFSEIYSWPAGEIADVEDFFQKAYPDPEYRAEIQGRVMADIASGDPARMRWRGVEATGKDGSTRIIEAQNIPLLDQGLMVSTVTDITAQTLQERKIRELEAQSFQAQKLETVGRLAGGIAHDFNNLLTIIQSYGEILASALSPADPLAADLQQIIDTADRGAQLTRQLLAISRRQVLQPKILDLNYILGDLGPMLRRIIGENIDLQVIQEKGLGLISADPSQLEQVLMNLVLNARDAMPHGGRLTLETANVMLDETYVASHPETRPGPHVMLAVTDTGVGVGKEIMARMFDPFFTTKEKGQGTGLGLATVYGIVKQSGGSIWVYSEKGEGTTFKVYLPRVVGEVASAERDISATESRGTETLLVVEDDDMVRELAARVLIAAGYRVFTAQNGLEALEILKALEALEALEERDRSGAQISLVVTDVVMPKMSGKELANRLAVDYPRIKVLFISGYTDNAIVHNGVLDEGTWFLAKPFTPTALSQKVREVLDTEP